MRGVFVNQKNISTIAIVMVKVPAAIKIASIFSSFNMAQHDGGGMCQVAIGLGYN
jgi:hypothetical protein